jgi:hypothetical protein
MKKYNVEYTYYDYESDTYGIRTLALGVSEEKAKEIAKAEKICEEMGEAVEIFPA